MARFLLVLMKCEAMNITLLLWFILGSFASHRIALMVSKEAGPAFIFKNLRKMPDKGTSLDEGIDCPWCVGVWASAGIVALLYPTLALNWRELIVFWLACASGNVCLNQAFTKG